MRQAAQPAGRASGRRIIERPRLIKLLEETTARTILLIAPAGYGKTTLARQWAERQKGVHWYTARTGSADVAQLAVDLAGALADAAPNLATYAAQLMQALPNPSQNARQIAESLATVAPDLSGETLIVDDFHVIADDGSASSLVHDLQAGLGVRLVVSSRVRPAWATARLQVYGELLEFGPEELALTSDEAIQVLGRPARQAATILKGARGWPAVVGLAAQADSELSSGTEAAATTLFRYFAEELFRATSPTLQGQFLTLALLPRLTRSLVELALNEEPEPIVQQAIESGLATLGNDGAELHPLIREYLLTKLAADRNADERIRSAVLLSLDEGYWDHAFELVTRFKATDLLDHLIERTFKPLVSSGRIATAEQIAGYGHAASHVSPLVDLIDAELAFRNGVFARAAVIAARAASELGGSHELASHAWWIAGQGAQLSFDDAKALSLFQKARETASNDDDLRDALWGVALTACQAETSSAGDAVQPLLARRDRSPIDRVRATAAEIVLERIVGSGNPIELADALHSVELISDPRIRTSFMNACVYYLILRARYDEANEVAEKMRETADAYQLKWARPHAHWALAATALGRRQITASTAWLRRVEHFADEGRFGPLLLNASCLRARQLLALRQPEDAWLALTVDETLPANRGMRGEFYATKALTLAVLGDAAESHAWIGKARTVTKCIEARAYAACAESILALHAGEPSSTALHTLAEVERTGMWDAFVSSVRAWPQLLTTLVAVKAPTASLIAALRNSYDFDLCKQVGLNIGRRPHQTRHVGTLSPREAEVLDLIRQGFTNQDIARALFISQSTVKVHVAHILEKTGARSRTEAAARAEATGRQQEPG